MNRYIVKLACVSAVSLLSACRGQTSTEPPIVLIRGMHEMPRYDAQEHSNYFADHRTMRPEVEGTVSREANVDVHYGQGVDDSGNYLPIIPGAALRTAGGPEPLIARGRERYGIYCAPCHGLTGNGNGRVSQRSNGMLQASNLFEDARLLHIPDGQLFVTISNGIRSMPAYRAQIPTQDRWAIVAYVRALQVSQANPAALDPDDDGVFGAADQCPTEAEDRDQFRDDDGCIDADNDGDGVADAADACSFAPGMADAATGNGCPVVVTVNAVGIVFPSALTFPAGVAALPANATAALEEARKTLVANPQAGKLRIVVGAGTDADMQLAAQRAEALKTWFVAHEVEMTRLEASSALVDPGAVSAFADFRFEHALPISAHP